jgi:hypothetical protein
MADPCTEPWLVRSLLEEFAALLTPQERRCLDYLCGREPCPVSEVYLRKLRQRLLRKFQAFALGRR